ncbi:vitamin K epoxide reductase complex subunit 1-like protein 1 [Rhopalosiphum padi]|uniref:vitamin K epoxide reductase complex subunit 1-like protein 1 n=1 Tax=Rhopalosiphum padi TaxID=40932 RepID=UPI00298DB3F8|nr:vitamin K epoxide reductase complex subunit 1-like protein 1 [Rhopalosiphum padi]
MVQLGTINMIIKAYALIGFCVSAYALYVEISLENDPDFEPLCDLRKYVKCSPAFISPYAKGFGIVRYIFGENSAFNVPNGLTGMLFYVLSFILSCSDRHKIVNVHYYLAIMSNVSTFYLASVLVFIVRELCLVCLTTYFINAISLLCVSSKRRQLLSLSTDHKSCKAD